MAKPATLLTLTATVTLLLLLLNISFGSTYISPFELLQLPFGRNQDLAEILWAFRLPKAVTCLLTGAALGTGGLLMQTLFRNPLAGPDVLGLSSGSSLLVALGSMRCPTKMRRWYFESDVLSTDQHSRGAGVDCGVHLARRANPAWV